MEYMAAGTKCHVHQPRIKEENSVAIPVYAGIFLRLGQRVRETGIICHVVETSIGPPAAGTE